MEREITHKEILEAINNFASSVDNRFFGMDQRFEQVEQRLSGIEAEMVTKDYLDERLADLRGDLVSVIRGEDKKIKKVVDILASKRLFSEKDKSGIYKMKPFIEKI